MKLEVKDLVKVLELLKKEQVSTVEVFEYDALGHKYARLEFSFSTLTGTEVCVSISEVEGGFNEITKRERF